LLAPCAFLDGGPTDRDHHNTVLVVDGYLMMPWAHEAGGGGVSVFGFRDPCHPEHVTTVTDPTMRETHVASIANLGDERWMVTASLGGIELWDITDPTAPARLTDFALPGVSYPDAYRRVVLSTSWQAPYVYVAAADNGVFIVDAADPRAPRLVGQYVPVPELRVGGVHAIGTLLVVLTTEGSRTVIADISDPAHPAPIPGGTYLIETVVPEFGGITLPATAYFGNFSGGIAYYAQTAAGGGLVMYDVSDPGRPRFVGHHRSGALATGAYVFLKEGLAFVGLSKFGEIVDVRDVANPVLQAHIEMTGDLDTVVPIGNVAVVSVDDDAIADQATTVQPYAREADTRGPRVNFVWPRDGARDVALGARIGVTFDEFVDVATLWRGSMQVREVDTGRVLVGTYSGQEGAANFWPENPLRPETAYEVVVPAGGVRDASGNAVEVEFRARFATVGCP
jgi:hypothetical protein